MQKTNLNVLLVDDDRIYKFSVKKIMETSGMVSHVVVCTDGKEALEYLTGATQAQGVLPDVIFLDINMPGMNGWEFLEAYEHLKDSFPKTIVIYIVTSSADAFDIAKSKRFDFVKGYLIKPVLKEKFLQILSVVAGA